MDVNIIVHTQKPVAFDSPDHITPWGTARDNSVNPAFNQKLLWWLPKNQVRVLDLGCSGGGFVRSMLEDGCIAVGLEGSDYSKKHARAEWPIIPEFLFTADITEPFDIILNGPEVSEQRLMFTVVTAWELIEHIAEDKLAAVMQNIDRHLAENGVVIMSVSPNEEIIDGVVLHQTVKPKDWWIEKFASLGFTHHPEALEFFVNDYIRWEANAANSFHVILTRTSEGLPYPHRLDLKCYEYGTKPAGLHLTEEFLNTQAFESEPLRVIDVGAAGGFENHWDNYQSQIELIGFELNSQECARLNSLEAEARFGRKEKFYPFAIGGGKAEHTLYQTINPQASSFLVPNEPFIYRYPQGDLGSIVGTEQIKTVSLEDFVREQNIPYVDFLKLDIEGFELQALKGARSLLESSVLGLSIEIFFQPYRIGQPTYGEIEAVLKEYGFSLFDIQFERWQRKTLAGHEFLSWYKQGQIMWGQAIFFRDLLNLGPKSLFKPTPVKARKLASIAEVFGFPDYGLELVMLADRLSKQH